MYLDILYLRYFPALGVSDVLPEICRYGVSQ